MARKKATDPATRRILNVIPSARTEDDWGLDIALSSGVVKKVSPLPAEVVLAEAGSQSAPPLGVQVQVTPVSSGGTLSLIGTLYAVMVGLGP